MNFRAVGSMTADELHAELLKHRGEWRHQLAHFIAMGGNPDDHNYARLSFLTRELRERGIAVESCRTRGLRLQ